MSITITPGMLCYIIPFTITWLFGFCFDSTEHGRYFSSSDRGTYFFFALPAATIISLLAHVTYLKFGG